jgi:hypothetical protein
MEINLLSDSKFQKKVAEILGGPEPQDYYFSRYGHGFVTNKQGVKRYYNQSEIKDALLQLSQPSLPITSTPVSKSKPKPKAKVK